MSNKRVTVEKINLTPCCKNTVPDASSRLFFLSFLLFLSSSFLFFFLFTMRAITIIAFTRARAGASLDGSNIELSKVGNCWRSERKNPRLEEPRKRTRGRDFTVGSRRNFYDRKPWQFGGLFFAIQRDHGYRNNTTRSPYLFPSDFLFLSLFS